MHWLTKVILCILSVYLVSCSDSSVDAEQVQPYNVFMDELKERDIDSLQTHFQADTSYSEDSVFVFYGKDNRIDDGALVLEIKDSLKTAQALQLNDSIFGKGIATLNEQYIIWRGDSISQPRLEISWEPHPTKEHVMVFYKRDKL